MTTAEKRTAMMAARVTSLPMAALTLVTCEASVRRLPDSFSPSRMAWDVSGETNSLRICQAFSNPSPRRAMTEGLVMPNWPKTARMSFSLTGSSN